MFTLDSKMEYIVDPSDISVVGSRKVKHRRFLKLIAITIAVVMAVTAFSVLAHQNPGNTTSGPEYMPESLDTGSLIYSVGIVIHNTQPVATSSPYDQEVQIDSSSFSQHESPDLSNVVWYTSSGEIIPSWIESGNSASSANTIYWLKMPFSLGAQSSVTINMGFESTSANLFATSGGSEGEAPQLSSSYAEYDNGAVVFPVYWNFAGTSTPSGIATGS